MSIRLRGTPNRLGSTMLSTEFSDWEIGEPEVKRERLLRSLGSNSLVLDANKYFMLPNKGGHATFIEQPDFDLGREESRHIVKFGQLILNGPGIHEVPDFVAIKPFDDKQGLYNEWASSAYVNGVFEEQRAFLPLGVLKDENDMPNLVSLYEHGVKTTDTVFWADKELQPEAFRKDVIINTASTCMYGLGLMHGARLIHGDAQVKNLGSDARHVRFIDLEDSLLIPEDGVDAEEFAKKIIRDIATFISSTHQVEENQDIIAMTLKKPDVVDKMIASYNSGINKARLKQDGVHIPDYATIHEDAIREIINRQFK